MNELELLKLKYSMLQHTAIVMQDRIKLKDQQIKELKEKLKEAKNEIKRLSLH